MKKHFIFLHFLFVNLTCATDPWDTQEAKEEWQSLSHHSADLTPLTTKLRPSPPAYLMRLYTKLTIHQNEGTGPVRCVLPCQGPRFSRLDFCHSSETDQVIKAVLHMRMREDALEETPDTEGVEEGSDDRVSINAVIEIDAGNATSVMAMSLYFGGATSYAEKWESNGEKNRKTRKKRKHWRELDITDLVTEARGRDWRIRVKFEEEKITETTGDVKVLAPSSIVDTDSDSPFIILFYENDPEIVEDGDSEGEGEYTAHSRRKRFVEITPDLEESHVRRNYYEHDDMNEIETKIVTFDRKDRMRKEGVDKYLDEDGNGIKDIDEEDELVLDYEEDDLSPLEARRHKLPIREGEDSQLPMPRRWPRRRKQQHKRRPGNKRRGERTRRRKQERSENRTDKWNTLPKIWKTFGRQLGPGQSLSKGPVSEMCSLQSLEIDLSRVGWAGKVISPRRYQANYCAGACSFPLSQGENPTNHATVLSILKRKEGLELPEPCCVPRKMESLTILFSDDDNSLVLKTFPQMIVKTCGCR